jgi:hypothetical protein
MKKYLLILFFFFYNLVSCSIPKPQTIGSTNLFRVIVFDDCEYYQIEYGIGEGRVYKLIHKEDCKNHF